MEKWEQGSLEEICERFEFNYGTAANASSVCRAFEFSRRRENLSFKHHAEVANRADADELLDWCEKTGASVQSGLRRSLQMGLEDGGKLVALGAGYSPAGD